MLSNENNMILEVWELIKEHTPDKARADAAVRLLTIMDDHDFSEEFKSLRGEDKWIDEALLDYIEEDEEEEEVELDYEDD